MGKSYPQQPLVGVGVVIKHPHDGRILMVKRDSEPYRGYWSIPGGGLKLGETLEECAHREVQEECGLKISIEGLATVFDSIEFINKQSAVSLCVSRFRGHLPWKKRTTAGFRCRCSVLAGYCGIVFTNDDTEDARDFAAVAPSGQNLGFYPLFF